MWLNVDKKQQSIQLVPCGKRVLLVVWCAGVSGVVYCGVVWCGVVHTVGVVSRPRPPANSRCLFVRFGWTFGSLLSNSITVISIRQSGH